MSGIPKLVLRAHDAIVKHLDPYDCHPSSKTTGIWTTKNQPINFTLVVDDFGVKYLIKEHTLHLKEALENKYTVTKDWEGKLYIGIALKWDHEKARSNFQCQAMYVQHYTHSNKKNQTKPGLTIPLDTINI